MGFIKEFKAFALKGNIIDLAVAVVIGAAFTAIVTSMVEDIITPLLLNPALKAAKVDNLDQLTWHSLKYGRFLAAVIKFILIALVLFGLIKTVNKVTHKHETPPPPPGPSSTDQLLMEIRDTLKNK
jgi:large conductance mechanosensitive channel